VLPQQSRAGISEKINMADVSLAKQLERLLGEVANVRDDLTVINAMIARQEASLQTVIVELRTMQRQFSRMNDRVAKLEDAS
jgi:predicted nuclease with TOPRIM domain